MSLDFNSAGSGRRVTHGSAASLDDLHNGTFSVWGWINRAANGANQFIFSKDTGAAGWNVFVTNTGGEGQLVFQTQRGTLDGTFFTVPTTSGLTGVPLNTFTFFGISYDPAATPQARIYIGYRYQIAIESAMSSQTAGTGTTPTDAAASLLVGNYAASNTLPFLGTISRGGVIDNRVVTAEEFQAIQVQSAIASTNVSGSVLVFDYIDTGNYSTDYSGNSNTGTLTSATNGAAHVPALTFYDVNDSQLFFSPYNTDSDGAGGLAANNVKGSSTFARWNSPNAYCKFRINNASGSLSTAVVMEFDTTSLSGLTANLCPVIGVSVNKSVFGRAFLVANTDNRMVVQLTTLLASGSDYDIEVQFVGIGHTTATDRWTTPANAVKIKGLWIDTTVITLDPSPLQTKNVLGLGASTSEGYASLSVGPAATAMDSTLAYARLFARAVGAELGMVAYAGTGFTKGIQNVTADSAHPSLASSTAANEWYDKYSAGRSRLVGGLFSPAPDWILIQLGFNDASLTNAEVAAALNKVQAAAPNAKIYVIDHQQVNITQLAGGIALMTDSSKTKLVTPSTVIISGTATEASFDSLHANGRGHALLAADILAQSDGGDDPIEPPIGRSFMVNRGSPY